MKARLDGIYSLDLPAGPPSLPPDPEDCWVVVQADIGPSEGTGTDIFTFYVCTIRRLEALVLTEGWQSGRYLIVVARFEWDVIITCIENILKKLQGDSWEQLATLIGQYGQWEFSPLSA